ncbi:hypothetical protein L1F30_00530 [Simiduia sp. 21SJ11W-1]|uniref:hypothetical protein n=1 Tax=Simiduia sp. 21SJ11W-1 TaxID=2909669 RepID=UPI00209CE93C|nr:hypothetical protein [Simiduia sp. 21SJ11W-1]UTA48040.1 hypothetical protein L1F30_00530 [Simiduia sp. 21SJ11W-1]
MKTAFILQNQHKLLLNKQREWVDATDLKSLYQTPYKDEAINQKVEVNAKDYTQRIHLLECPLNDKGLPQIPEDAKPAPLPKAERNTEQAALLEGAGDDATEPDALSSANESASDNATPHDAPEPLHTL